MANLHPESRSLLKKSISEIDSMSSFSPLNSPCSPGYKTSHLLDYRVTRDRSREFCRPLEPRHFESNQKRKGDFVKIKSNPSDFDPFYAANYQDFQIKHSGFKIRLKRPSINCKTPPKPKIDKAITLRVDIRKTRKEVSDLEKVLRELQRKTELFSRFLQVDVPEMSDSINRIEEIRLVLLPDPSSFEESVSSEHKSVPQIPLLEFVQQSRKQKFKRFVFLQTLLLSRQKNRRFCFSTQKLKFQIKFSSSFSEK